MSDKKPDQEPSIEEILASIRQIISDDDAGGSAPLDKPAEPPPPPANDDVIDLTEKVDPVVESFPSFLEDPIEEEPPAEDVKVELRDPVEEEPALMPSSSLDFDDPVPSAPEDPAPILTDRAAGAALAAFSRLSGSMPIRRPDSPGEGTLEDIVRDMLKPMLRAWLDDNLPPIIEKLVRRELEKLSQKAMED